ncbi:hydroxyacid oxidase 1 [Trichonephila clavipes]|uniref:(S)-2-hydroxy-acid oxidase n=1 Tax=Trichonephila clavipes TaxID=2585209 RepID=A0A8X6SXM7_TRICX|nr:hydroxyacid oxidase 1 [Trichonephila clavipes]
MDSKILCLNDFEKYAKKNLDRKALAFYSQGAEREFTLKENFQCFTRYIFIPRMLRGPCNEDLSTTVLGEKISMPIGISPMAYQRLAHPEGEVAAAKAAADAGVVYTLSTVSTTSIKDLADSRPKSPPLWMQLYVFKNRLGARTIIRNAEANGYKALVLTVDTPMTGLQLRQWRNGLELPPHLSAPNLADALKEANAPVQTETHSSNVHLLHATSWEDVKWIKSITKLPLILKGILSVEDALEAVKYGVAAIWVSNHGGRQLDCVPTTLDALSKIAPALAGTGCEVYVDGGFRWGSDVLKALALGARAVFIGRPVLWALNHSGQDGVRLALDILRSELVRAMLLSGCTSLKDAGPHMIQKQEIAKI